MGVDLQLEECPQDVSPYLPHIHMNQVEKKPKDHVQGKKVIDSLPYFDTYDDEMKSRVEDLIQQEIKTNSSRKKDIPIEPYQPSFQTLFLQNEWKRVSSKSNEKDAPLSNITSPQRFQPVQTPLSHDNLSIWEEALEKAKIQREYLRNEEERLELLQVFGANAWIKANSWDEHIRDSIKNELESTQRLIEEINLDRKKEQQGVGSKIEILKSQWLDLVKKNQKIDTECQILQSQMDQLRQ